LLYVLSGCTSAPESTPSTQKATTKILINKSDAQDAQNEYKALQDKRVRE
jgi:hypothetical protein